MTDETGFFYFGNAAIDQIRGTGWFVGQFVPLDWGLRHQTDVELKWAIHADGEQRRHGPEANGNATTISVLIHGVLRATFHIDGTPHVVCRMNNGIEAAELAPAGDTPALRQDGEGLPPRLVVRLADGHSTCQYRQR